VSGDRILLCRPQGGLNDILSQIERACRHGERFGRTVVVETDSPSTHFFWDSLGYYFVSRDRRLVLDAAQLRGRLDGMQTHPAGLTGRVNRYAAALPDGGPGYVDAETGEPLTFDFDRDHPEPLLVHHQGGGAPYAPMALARMRLHDALADALLQRLATIGSAYTGVHIRNTDRASDYLPHLERWAVEIPGPIFLATDDRAARDDCRRILGEARVFSFSALPAQAGLPLHSTAALSDRRRLNADAILDLLMLALARNLRAVELKPNASSARFSGFSVLAASLREARPILSGLIDRTDRRLAPVLA
jgi:hypothetical protein